VANVLANRYNKSYDRLRISWYSLSDQTAKIVKGLKQNAAITNYDRQSGLPVGDDMLGPLFDASPGFA